MSYAKFYNHFLVNFGNFLKSFFYTTPQGDSFLKWTIILPIKETFMLEFKTSFTNSKSLKVFLLNTICFHSFSYGSSFYIKTTFVVKLLLLNMNFHSFHLCFIVSCCFCNKLVFCETPIRVKFSS